MKLSKKLLLLPVIAVMPLAILSACHSTNGNVQESQQQLNDTTTLEIVLPLPHFGTSEIRMELIQEEAIQAFGLSSTSFFFNQGEREPIQVCASVGLPIPADSSLSNPWQVSNGANLPNTGSENVAIGQMDPNGIYMGPTNATYVLCKTASGNQYLVHAEEFVHAVTAQAYWDPKMFGGKGGIHVVGQPQIPDCTQVKTIHYTDSNGNSQSELESVCKKPAAEAPVPAASPSQ
jgi:hypothetical protein